jgi:phenylacetate-CoA ligase
MPLIRYEIGDVGRWAADQSCPCGRELPLLAEVNGRTTDFLILKDGRRVSGPALTLVVADMADVAQVQFHQKSTEQVTLKVVPGKSFGPHTIAELKRRLDLYLRGAAELTIEPVESIPSELSGKYRFVISTIGESV